MQRRPEKMHEASQLRKRDSTTDILVPQHVIAHQHSSGLEIGDLIYEPLRLLKAFTPRAAAHLHDI